MKVKMTIEFDVHELWVQNEETENWFYEQMYMKDNIKVFVKDVGDYIDTNINVTDVELSGKYTPYDKNSAENN